MAADERLIFRNTEDVPIKCFIQKDLPEDVQDELRQNVEDLGGQVTAAVPRAGYVLIDPGTKEGERLRACWTDKARPDRYFVPFTWVDACRAHKLELRQIFVKEGQPLKVCIHPSISNLNVREALKLRIVHSGGDPTVDHDSADVILADPDTPVFQRLIQQYKGAKCIESFLWVKTSIESGVANFTHHVYKNLGGRRAGEDRTAFSPQDDEHLCQYVAEKKPHKADGGRTGNKLWQELMAMKDLPGYSWASRHTWQSWRERLKKNRERLEPRITQIVEERQSLPPEQIRLPDTLTPPPPRRARKKTKRAPVPEPAADDSADLEGQLNNLTGTTLSPTPDASIRMEPMELPEMPVAGPAPRSPSPVPEFAISQSPVSQAPSLLQIAQATAGGAVPLNESQDWMIRVGNDPPPRWAPGKRKRDELDLSDDLEDEKDEEMLLQFPPEEDSEIQEIARSTQFTEQEVRQFLQRCNDTAKTRERFQAMRALLADNFD